MSHLLKQLNEPEKQAIVALACLIEAQGKGGRFRSNDPEVEIIVDNCFDESWIGHWHEEFRHMYLGKAAQTAANNLDECIAKVASLDIEVKFAFKTMMIDVIGDSAIMTVVAAHVYRQIGLPEFTPPKQRETTREVRNTQEDDGTCTIDEPFYRLMNSCAIRGNNDTVFTMVDEDADERITVGANYEYWLQEGICPVNGIVGYVDPGKNVLTEEGTLSYLVCPGNLVVPVLSWGLEKIDEWAYRQKSQHNRMISCDRSGKLCKAQMKNEKPYDGSFKQTRSATATDSQVVRFVATVQERFEDGMPTAPANYIERDICLTYTKRGSELRLEVIGVMRPRNARFQNDDGRILKYVDKDIPYAYYEVETEPVHNSIVRVSIFQKNQFFQDLEYRYTIDR